MINRLCGLGWNKVYHKNFMLSLDSKNLLNSCHSQNLVLVTEQIKDKKHKIILT